MGDELFHQYVVLANIPYRVLPALLAKQNSIWFDDVTTPQIETKNEIIRKSINDALNELEQRLGTDMKQWRWGKIHTITFKHLFGDVRPLGTIVNVGPFPIGGSGTTPNNAEYRFNTPYSVVLGPSMRKIIDFENVNGAISVLPTGESGQPLHQHYKDQTQLWLNGEYHSMPLNEEIIRQQQRYILELHPMQ
jgi:penicillin amidase